ncbi:tetrahydrocannabinolic acid synthase-like [Dorcoceras hygrometricum]|uniref:Tetrahydrocannabinolic acid synthase-like n=1 Tax=Dorcoceras hygrometricum TaxID=472368 RepID=A0A2Z7A983_9LAMI|nr:tetrahydrocannabinolic acid synthase-like [Dorcoceras hygrometricum]
MKRRRAGESADGLALMTSSMTSSYSADGLREQSQESADSADALCVEIHSVARYQLEAYVLYQLDNQTQATAASVESFNEPAVAMNPVASFAYSVDLVLGTKKTISSSYICPADGSQYKQSAVGLVFMESAAGLAMETSKVESAVRNQAEAKLNQLEHNKPAGTMTTSCKR